MLHAVPSNHSEIMEKISSAMVGKTEEYVRKYAKRDDDA
jgi:hypothetical protein